jgi:arginase
MKTSTILTPFFLDSSLAGLEAIKEWDWIVNRPPLPEAAQMERMAVIHESLAQSVEKACIEKTLPVSIAGDCCAALGMLAGLVRAGLDPVLIWFDAHGDFNTRETSPSGFLGGMPLAMLVGKGDQTFMESLDLDPIAEEKVILTDARDLDPEEKVSLSRSSVTHLHDPMELLDYTFSGHPVWVHFDTDVLDPEEVPAQNYPAPGGIRTERLKEVFQYLAGTGQVKAVSLSSWAPDLPGAERSSEVSMALLDVLIQESR